MNFRRHFLSAAVSALAAMAFSAPLTASAQMVLKAADVHPAGYPNVVAIENLGKKLAAATNGKYKLTMFPGGVLGGEKESVYVGHLCAAHARVALGLPEKTPVQP